MRIDFASRTGQHSRVEYPELASETRRFSYGAPRAVTVSGDGRRVMFLRSTGPRDPHDSLWVFDLDTRTERLIASPQSLEGGGGKASSQEQSLRERQRLSASGIGSFALDGCGTTAVYTIAGQIFLANCISGHITKLPTPSPAMDPRLDPLGRYIAYITEGALRVLDLSHDDETPTDTVLASEEGMTWGLADFIGAEEFHRYRGYWWAPDGRSLLATRVDESRVPIWYLHDPSKQDQKPRTIAYPHAGAPNAIVTLHLLHLDGGWVDVRWDTHTYPYLVSVSWSDNDPLIFVLRRSQRHGVVMAVDSLTGETQIHAELTDLRWVDPLPGTPVRMDDGRVLISGELTYEEYDSRCLFADGSLVTPTNIYVRRLVGHDDSTILIEGSQAEPSEQHLYRVHLDKPHTTTGPQFTRLTTSPGWHHAVLGGSTLVIGSTSLEHHGCRYDIYHDGELISTIPSRTATPPYTPRPTLSRITDRHLPTGVLYPRSHVPGHQLPVLVDIYGGPGHQEVVAMRSRWLERQWWADQGFIIAVIDNRGTPGISPSFDKSIYHRFADVILADQVDALLALADKHPDMDLSQVAIRGWSFGGWLAALAILCRPDIYHVGIAGAPVSDWLLYDTAYSERYLGHPEDRPEIYAHNNLVELAERPPTSPQEARPLLLIHGLADDNVVAAHTLRLSAALLTAGRPHCVIPLTGVTHMAAGGVAERLLRLERDFIRDGFHSRSLG